MNDVSLLIIAGGKSSRLGRDKRFVEIGGVGLLESMLRKASARNFAEIFLCVDRQTPEIKSLSDAFNATILLDEISAAGPAAGLSNGLRKISSDWALAVSIDMPFFDFAAFEPIFDDQHKIIIPRVGGRLQPLAAFYHRSTADAFEKNLSAWQKKLRATIDRLPHRIIDLDVDENIFFNVNTRADLHLALGRAENLSRPTPIVSIVAPSSGTGKTTFIERLTKIFSDQNIKIGVIKSDAHGFNLDVEGKDSWRFQRAGADAVAVVSPHGWFLTQRTDERADFFTVADKMTGVDLILTESRTRKIFPTVSLWRGLGDKIVDEKICAVFSSAPEASDEIAEFHLDDLKSAEAIIKFLAGT